MSGVADVRLKKGVELHPHYAMAVGHSVVVEVFRQYGYSCKITSGTEGQHMVGSLHSYGDALDYESHHVAPAHKHLILAEARERLGENFDFLLEDEGKANEHYHLEFDPD